MAKTAKLHRLTGAGPILGKPEPDVVELVKKLMAEVKAGNVKGFGYFAVTATDGIVTNWASGCASGNMMTAGVAKLAFRVTDVSLE